MKKFSFKGLYFVVCINSDYDKRIVPLDRNGFFTAVSQMICMSDCTEERVLGIVYNGDEYQYMGWRPGLEYGYRRVDDPESEEITIWLNPDIWDH